VKSGITILRLLIICIVSVSCFSGGKQDVPDPRPEAGVIHSSCRLKNDSTFSCALYIPKALQDSVRPPCIIFFDPHSNGQIPVKAYQSLADKFGWILMGSNQVRNGMAPEQIDLIVGLLFSEACHAIRADSNRIYLGGFSGGARVKCLLQG
jgi:predicted peptidase